jgi:hypothetical protein
MALVNLTADISSYILDINNPVGRSAYRLYVNSELMTERTWIWADQSIIKEILWVDIDNTDQHTINLEQIYSHRKDPNILISMSHLDVLTHQFEILNSDSNSITFRIV